MDQSSGSFRRKSGWLLGSDGEPVKRSGQEQSSHCIFHHPRSGDELAGDQTGSTVMRSREFL